MKEIKIILAVLLLICLFHMPYGYYNLVRMISLICFCVIAYRYFVENKVELALTFCGLALLFQPFLKIPLGRTLWNIVDVTVAILLFFLALIYDRKIR